MGKEGSTVSYTADEIKARRERRGSLSDWGRADAMTEKELEAAIASDPDEAGIVWDFDSLTTELPKPPDPKAVLNMRVDQDVLDFFRDSGKGYQTRINSVLRAYVDQIRARQSR